MVDVKLRKLGCQNCEGYVMKYNAVASQTISHGETLEIGGTESGQFEPPVLPFTRSYAFNQVHLFLNIKQILCDFFTGFRDPSFLGLYSLHS